MSSANAASDSTTVRKTSGSESRSSVHSPVSSPNSTHRMSTSSTPNNMFGAAMVNTGSGGLSLNSGWEVWGGQGTPSSHRNTSISSSAGVSDSAVPPQDTGYRAPSNAETWGRSASGSNWVASNTGPAAPKNAQETRAASYSSSSYKQRSRHEQSEASTVPRFTGPPMEDRGRAPYSSHGSKFRPSIPATGGPFQGSLSGFAGQQLNTVPIHSSFDPSKISSMVENELAMGMRGMVVEDDHQNTARQHVAATPSAVNGPQNMGVSNVPQIKVSPQQAGNVYNTFAQPDYGTYYAAPPVEYQYQYDSYRRAASDLSFVGGSAPTSSPSPGTVYNGMSTHPDTRQPGVYFDYSRNAQGQAPPHPQYYYSTPPMMYPAHSPMPTPQLSPATPIAHDKKAIQNFMYHPMRSTPSPHPQPYAPPMDYSAQMSLMLPGTPLYGSMGLNPQAMHLYQQNMRSGRIGGDSSVMTLRSPLLDEFRANKTRKWELRDIFGYVVEFSGDQHGSRFIQQKLEQATAEERQIVFDEIVPDSALQLTQDVFGNYVVQKLFEYGTQVQKTMLAKTMEGHTLTLSLQMYGCRVVQKAIEFVLPEQQSLFVAELEVHVLKCVKDANGNHVIQKLLERVAPERLAFINTFKGHVYDLSTHPYGCRVLQRCFEHLPEEYTRPLLDELHRYTLNLMQDQFGNYVIQFVLERGKPQDRALIIQKLRGQLLQMARHKFASNVCEKALVTADSETRQLLVQEMITPRPDGVSPVVTMMKDQYANYVLQRALMVVGGPERDALVGKIKPQLATMRRYSSTYSKHLASIEKLVEKASAESREEKIAAGIDPDSAADGDTDGLESI